VVDYFGRALLRLDEAVSIGILEATVHLLDLQRALGAPPDVPAAGVEHTVALLAEMAPPLDFIELATGRSSVALFLSCAEAGSAGIRCFRSRSECPPQPR
jgi:hypothetical protein